MFFDYFLCVPHDRERERVGAERGRGRAPTHWRILHSAQLASSAIVCVCANELNLLFVYVCVWVNAAA